MLFIGIGGLLGAMTRFLLGKWITSKTPALFPFGTMIINITGSFTFGILASFHLSQAIPEWIWFLFGIGFLGSYTTFSTFGVEAMQLIQKKELRNAVVYVTTSVVLGIIFAWIGGLVAGPISYSL